MEEKEILEKAIEQAFRNGFSIGGFDSPKQYFEWFDNGNLGKWWEVIFSHYFAKAFFGTGRRFRTGRQTWKDHLQKMVLEENPIKYLEQFLPVEDPLTLY
jgi:hypothetical protein